MWGSKKIDTGLGEDNLYGDWNAVLSASHFYYNISSCQLVPLFLNFKDYYTVFWIENMI